MNLEVCRELRSGLVEAVPGDRSRGIDFGGREANGPKHASRRL